VSADVLCVRIDCWRVRSNAAEFFWQLGVSLLESYLVREKLTHTIVNLAMHHEVRRTVTIS
jgi:hypothetical protein